MEDELTVGNACGLLGWESELSDLSPAKEGRGGIVSGVLVLKLLGSPLGVLGRQAA